ncbi:MAG: lipopolysaccharide biosynthesis protein [Solirubrobacteraceae bacterium]
MSSTSRSSRSALQDLTTQIGEHATIYAGGTALNIVLSLATVAAFTRFIPPRSYGQLSILMFGADLLAMVYDLGLLQGTMRAIFAVTPGGGFVRDEGERREVLTTALLVSLLAASAGTLIVALNVAAIAHWLVPHEGRDLVIYAALTGGTVAVLRLVSNQLRYQRRPVAYNVIFLSRSLGTLVVGIVLLNREPSLRNAVLATWLGAVIGLLLTMLTMRNQFARWPSVLALKRIWRLGVGWIPVSLSLWVVNAGGVVVLAVLASEQAVGLYRAILRISSIASYGVGVFFMAWGPLARSSVYQVARQQLGVLKLNALLATTYSVGAATIVFALAICQHELILIVGPLYRRGASLIPVLALPPALYGFFRISYVTSTDPRRVRRFRFLCMFAAVIFLVTSGATAGVLGEYAIGLGGSVAFIVATVLMVTLGAPGDRRLVLEKLHVAKAIAAGATSLGVARVIAFEAPDARVLADLVGLALLPVALVGSGAVRWSTLRTIVPMPSRSSMGRSRGAAWRERLTAMAPEDIARLRDLLRDRDHTPHEPDSSRPEADPTMWAVGKIKEIAGAREGSGKSELLARYLLAAASVPARDAMANDLVAAGEDPHDLDAMSRVVRLVRRGAMPQR